MSIVSQGQQGVLVSRDSVPRLNEAVRITRQLRTDQLALPPNRTPAGGGSSAYYFAVTKESDTTIKVANIRYRAGKTLGTLLDQTKTIPTAAGTYYIYLQALYTTSYTFSIEVSAVNTHPDQADVVSPAARAWREEIAAVVVADSVIASFAPIWAGQIMAIEGRIV